MEPDDTANKKEKGQCETFVCTAEASMESEPLTENASEQQIITESTVMEPDDTANQKEKGQCAVFVCTAEASMESEPLTENASEQQIITESTVMEPDDTANEKDWRQCEIIVCTAEEASMEAEHSTENVIETQIEQQSDREDDFVDDSYDSDVYISLDHDCCPSDDETSDPIYVPTAGDGQTYHNSDSESDDEVSFDRNSTPVLKNPIVKTKALPSEGAPTENVALHNTVDSDPVPVLHEYGGQDGPCKESDMPESELLRDILHPEIFIRKIKKVDVSPHGKRKTNRVQNSRHACLYCKCLVHHISVHMSFKHKHEADVSQILLSDKNERTNAFSLLRVKGDHEHNLRVVDMKKGELLLNRRPTGPFNHTDYGPCPHCFDWVAMKSLPKHIKSCKCFSTKDGEKRPRKGTLILQSNIILDNLSHKPSKAMQNEVYTTMKNDEVSQIAQNDVLIVMLGESWLRRNWDNETKRRYYASQHMRHCARLLMALREREKQKKELPNAATTSTTPKSLWDFLRPAYFEEVVEAALDTAVRDVDDEDELKSPSNAIKIKYDILRMTNAKRAVSGRENDKKPSQQWVKWKAEAADFLDSLRTDWSDRVTRLARKILNERSLNKVERIPKPEDIQKLGLHLVNKIDKTKLNPKKVTWEIYKDVAQTIIARLLTYNKRRSGELEAAKVKNFVGRKSEADIDQGLMGSLTATDKFLLKTHDLMDIRGKNGRPVPVLLPTNTVKPLEFLADPKVRKAAGVPLTNAYLFPNQRNEKSTLRAYECLKAVCKECGLETPERITSVTMRHYMATLTQVMKLDDHELDWVTRHLGHTKDVHLQHYRVMSPFLEKVMIGKLLLMQDLNIQQKFVGKALADVDFSDLLDAADKDREYIGVPSSDKDREHVGMSIAEDTYHDDEDEEDEEPPAKKKKSNVRQPWSPDEVNEISRYFKRNLDNLVTPGKTDVEAAIQQSKANGGVLHKRHYHLIVKKCSNLIQKRKRDLAGN